MAKKTVPDKKIRKIVDECMTPDNIGDAGAWKDVWDKMGGSPPSRKPRKPAHKRKREPAVKHQAPK